MWMLRHDVGGGRDTTLCGLTIYLWVYYVTIHGIENTHMIQFSFKNHL